MWGRVILLGLERGAEILVLERGAGIHRGPLPRAGLMIQDECDPRLLVLGSLSLLALEHHAVRREQSSPWKFVTLLEQEQHAVRRERDPRLLVLEFLPLLVLEHHAVRREQSSPWELVTPLEPEQHAGRREQPSWEPVTLLGVEQHAVLRRTRKVVLRRIRKVAPLKLGSLIRAGYDHMCLVQEPRQLEERVAGQFDVTLLRGGRGRLDDSDSHRVFGSQAKAI